MPVMSAALRSARGERSSERSSQALLLSTLARAGPEWTCGYLRRLQSWQVLRLTCPCPVLPRSPFHWLSGVAASWPWNGWSLSAGRRSPGGCWCRRSCLRSCWRLSATAALWSRESMTCTRWPRPTAHWPTTAGGSVGEESGRQQRALLPETVWAYGLREPFPLKGRRASYQGRSHMFTACSSFLWGLELALSVPSPWKEGAYEVGFPKKPRAHPAFFSFSLGWTFGWYEKKQF